MVLAHCGEGAALWACPAHDQYQLHTAEPAEPERTVR